MPADQHRIYGKYRAIVADNQDPQTRGRLKLCVPALLAEVTTDWALPCLPFGGLADQGMFMVPEVDALVWVEFEAGDISHPIWTGTFWPQSSDIPTEAMVNPPTTRVLKTPAGHVLQFDDAEGEERLLLKHPTGAKIEIDPNGNITIDDAFGNTVQMGASGITVKGQLIAVEGAQTMLGGHGGEPVIKGSSFLTLFAQHVHPSAAGPSGPPIPQGEVSTLSSKVTSI